MTTCPASLFSRATPLSSTLLPAIRLRKRNIVVGGSGEGVGPQAFSSATPSLPDCPSPTRRSTPSVERIRRLLVVRRAADAGSRQQTLCILAGPMLAGATSGRGMLKALLKEQRAKVEEIKKKTDFYSTHELLARYNVSTPSSPQQHQRQSGPPTP
ncbi:hypothetical protein C8R44DRAFT_749145 [Mycena epipterygia]|nr:hypothetical protein C8R44DRAFT_749145 [Mycena epipterygia]